MNPDLEGLSFVLPAGFVEAVAERVAELLGNQRDASRPGQNESASRYVSIVEAAVILRCGRGRIDDLLSQRRLTRVKEGSRTLILRTEIEDHLQRQPPRSR